MLLLAQGVESSPVLLAVLAVLAVPGVTSLLTKGLRTFFPNVKGETLVYFASLVLTGVWMWSVGNPLPAIDLSNPPLMIFGWLAWAKVNSSNAELVYNALKAALPGLFAP